MDEFFNIDWSAYLDQITQNPFAAMWFFFSNGFWLFFVWLGFELVKHLWLNWRQSLYSLKKTYVVLAISIPKTTEQGPRAVENMFAFLSGAHGSISTREKWIEGMTQDVLSFELVSDGGRIQYHIRTVERFRDLIEAAVYAQYPEAEINEVSDYTLNVPGHFPDEEYDMWGVEFTNVKPDVYPIKTYEQFEDKIAMEFKDPLTGMFEALARIAPDEHAWFQIILTPIEQSEFHKACEKMIKKLTGQKDLVKKGIIGTILEIPVHIVKLLMDNIAGNSPDTIKKGAVKKEDGGSKYKDYTSGQKEVIDAVHKKSSKLAYKVKLRFVYIARKESFKKAKIMYSFIGSIKQFNTNTMQALKPDFKHIGMKSSFIFFRDARNNDRRNKLIRNYRGRTNWGGLHSFYMTVDELASIWHFPHSLQNKSPQMKKTESKRQEPPINLPFE